MRGAARMRPSSNWISIGFHPGLWSKPSGSGLDGFRGRLNQSRSGSATYGIGLPGHSRHVKARVPDSTWDEIADDLIEGGDPGGLTDFPRGVQRIWRLSDRRSPSRRSCALDGRLRTSSSDPYGGSTQSTDSRHWRRSRASLSASDDSHTSVRLHVVRTAFLRSKQCWYCASRASGMNRIRSSGQPVSAATAKTWAATKPGSSQAGAFFPPVPTRDRPVPPPVRGSVPPGAGRLSGNPPGSARRRRSGRLPGIPGR